MDKSEMMNRVNLIKEAVSGNVKAVEAIYNEYLPLMRGVCGKIVRDREVVDDLVHDSFILAVASLGKLRNPDRLGEWLTTIVRNVSLKYLEEKRRSGQVSIYTVCEDDLELFDDINTPESYVSEKELLELIAHLPPGYRKVFKLSVIKGFSHQEIAELLHIKPHSVSSQLMRAKALLRNLMTALFVLFVMPLFRWLIHRGSVEELKEKVAVQTGAKNLPKQEGNGFWSVCDSFSSSVTGFSMKVEEIQCLWAEKLEPEDSVEVDLQRRETAYRDGVENSGENLEKIELLSRVNLYRSLKDKKHRSKSWQLLVSGASSSSFMQSVTNMVIGSGDTDPGGTPSVPIVLHTWEEYAHYLESRMHEDMPEDSLALIHIAKNNSGEMVEEEHHERPVTWGLSFSKRMGRNWALHFGLQYSVLKSDFKLGGHKGEAGNDSCYISKEQKVSYIGLPLGVSYDVLSKRSFSVYASVSTVLHIPVYSRQSERYIIEPEYEKTIRVHHFMPKVQWSLGVSLGVQYRLSPNWSLYAEPTFKWYIPNGSEYHTSWTENPCVFTVPFGVRLTW